MERQKMNNELKELLNELDVESLQQVLDMLDIDFEELIILLEESE